jgi:lipopolysaccharide biosynthesis protein
VWSFANAKLPKELPLCGNSFGMHIMLKHIMLKRAAVLLVVVFAGGAHLYPQMLWEEMKRLGENIKIDFSLFPTKNAWQEKECSPVLDTPSKNITAR